jgi:hypothetical protein
MVDRLVHLRLGHRGYIDEPRARLTEALRRSLGPETINGKAVLPNSRGDRHEIAVARHDPKTINMTTVEQVHGIDGHLHVGGIFAFGDVKLLLRLDGMAVCYRRPAFQSRFPPVAVSPSDVDGAKIAENCEDRLKTVRTGVIGIDQESDVSVLLVTSIRHSLSPFLAFARPSFTHWRKGQVGEPTEGEGHNNAVAQNNLRLVPRIGSGMGGQCYTDADQRPLRFPPRRLDFRQKWEGSGSGKRRGKELRPLP